uniref:Endonuclease/exonuclease/phosphatase domain-containing protein n=1 Tax=Hordeum vulgare subsp. vulgare TaxID=112509 RepID=A0A8I6YAL9_HORVV
MPVSISCISWNWGAWESRGSLRASQYCGQELLHLLFVKETKISTKRVESLQHTLGFTGCYDVTSVGLSGGIRLFWSKEVDVEPKNFSSGHIDVMVRSKDHASREWRFTGFYKSPRVEDRYHSWRFLRTLHALSHFAWLCMGDFNETLYATEYFSNSARPEWQMRAFREVIDDFSFQDLGWLGLPYTRDNRHGRYSNAKARLDRAFANEEFVQLFEHVRVRHVCGSESYHYFIVAHIN